MRDWPNTQGSTNFPVILFGKKYWGGMINWLRDHVLAANNIHKQDIESIHVVDDPELVRDIVVKFHERAMKTNKYEDDSS